MWVCACVLLLGIGWGLYGCNKPVKHNKNECIWSQFSDESLCVCVNDGNNKKQKEPVRASLVGIAIHSFPLATTLLSVHENWVSQPKQLEQHGFKTEQEAECTLPQLS